MLFFLRKNDRERTPYWARKILRNQDIIMATIQELQAAVQRTTDAEDSVIVLLKGIAQQLKDAGGNPVEIQKVITALDANTAKLAAAVVENTPPVVEPPVTPPTV
jgi:hypothetical protein